MAINQEVNAPSLGFPADEAWPGSGEGSIVAILKAVYAALAADGPGGTNALSNYSLENGGNLAAVNTNTAATKASVDNLTMSVGGVGDSAWAGTGNASTVAVLKGIWQKVSGTLAISAAALPLPAGAATEGGNLATIAANTTANANSASATATNTGTIATNTGATATSTAATATSVATIATNTNNTATNTASIATSAATIATNTSNNATSASTTATNTGTIATNTGNSATSAATIATQVTAINSATGTQAEAAWSGSGNGTVNAVLKALYNRTATSLGAVTDAAWGGSGSANTIMLLKAIWSQLPPAPGPTAKAQALSVTMATDQPAMPFYCSVARATTNVTMTSGTAVTAALDFNATVVVGILMPAAWTAAALNIEVSPDNVTWYTAGVYDSTGVATGQWPSFTAGGAYAIDVNSMLPYRYLRLRSGTAVSSVNQAADRVFTFITRPLA